MRSCQASAYGQWLQVNTITVAGAPSRRTRTRSRRRCRAVGSRAPVRRSQSLMGHLRARRPRARSASRRSSGSGVGLTPSVAPTVDAAAQADRLVAGGGAEVLAVDQDRGRADEPACSGPPRRCRSRASGSRRRRDRRRSSASRSSASARSVDGHPSHHSNSTSSSRIEPALATGYLAAGPARLTLRRPSSCRRRAAARSAPRLRPQRRRWAGTPEHRAVDVAEDADRRRAGRVLGKPGERERQARVGPAPDRGRAARPRRRRRRRRSQAAVGAARDATLVRRRRSGSACRPRGDLVGVLGLLLGQRDERAVVEHRAVLVDLDQRTRPRACAAARSTSVRCWRSRSIVRATNVASAPSASATGLNGWSATPNGVDLVTLPSSEVGDAWPLVSP